MLSTLVRPRMWGLLTSHFTCYHFLSLCAPASIYPFTPMEASGTIGILAWPIRDITMPT